MQRDEGFDLLVFFFSFFTDVPKKYVFKYNIIDVFYKQLYCSRSTEYCIEQVKKGKVCLGTKAADTFNL